MSAPAGPPRPGCRSALVVLVPQAEPLVADTRFQHDPAAAEGVPAHVTVLYPFIPPHRLDEAAVARVAACFAVIPRFGYALTRVARFPGVLYVAPEPAEPLRALTLAAWRAFPDFPPYGGRYPDIVPHLTVAATADEAALSRVAAAFAPIAEAGLPIRAEAREVAMLTDESGPWRTVATFPLGG
ncbi:2'-5' RNA ligase family protein [Roseomonas sp. CCTCC AB2023176]|uniref:2'-5' RNA ligase family protein n=1 Tax=Roseomonas sp. CCTCC AB2023176 TaxID=3342640 RepID=UPI0035DB2882